MKEDKEWWNEAVKNPEEIASMEGVRDYAEDQPVKLVRMFGRLCIEARNESGCNHTLVDLLDLVAWLKNGPPEGRLDDGFRFVPDAKDH